MRVYCELICGSFEFLSFKDEHYVLCISYKCYNQDRSVVGASISELI